MNWQWAAAAGYLVTTTVGSWFAYRSLAWLENRAEETSKDQDLRDG